MADEPVRPPAYSVEIASEDDFPAVLELWAESFEALRGRNGLQKLRWQYLDTPAGAGLLFVLRDDAGRVVGAQGIGRRTLYSGGRLVSGGIMADFVVAARHRSLGPAMTLLEGASRASRAEVEFLYGFPNRRALPVFKRAGYRELGRTWRFAMLLRSRAFLRRRMPDWCATLLAALLDPVLLGRDLLGRLRVGPGLRWSTDEDFDEHFDALWRHVSAGPRLTAERSQATLRWRFATGADALKVTTARDPDTGALRGYVVWNEVDGIATVLDFLAAAPDAVKRLLRRVAWEARQAGCTALNVEFGGCEKTQDLIIAAGLSRREDWPVYCIVGPDVPDLAETGWYVTEYDRDG